METKRITSATLAIFIGGMSVLVGSMALLSLHIPTYTTIIWLIIYNIILGVFSIYTAFLIWKNDLKSKIFIIAILLLHTLILIKLYFFTVVVANESKMAMIFRVSIWTVIFLLNYKSTTPLKKNKI